MPNFFFGQLHQLVCPSKMVIHAFQMGHLGSLKKIKKKVLIARFKTNGGYWHV